MENTQKEDDGKGGQKNLKECREKSGRHALSA